MIALHPRKEALPSRIAKHTTGFINRHHNRKLGSLAWNRTRPERHLVCFGFPPSQIWSGIPLSQRFGQVRARRRRPLRTTPHTLSRHTHSVSTTHAFPTPASAVGVCFSRSRESPFITPPPHEKCRYMWWLSFLVHGHQFDVSSLPPLSRFVVSLEMTSDKNYCGVRKRKYPCDEADNRRER